MGPAVRERAPGCGFKQPSLHLLADYAVIVRIWFLAFYNANREMHVIWIWKCISNTSYISDKLASRFLVPNARISESSMRGISHLHPDGRLGFWNDGGGGFTVASGEHENGAPPAGSIEPSYSISRGRVYTDIG